MLTRKEYSTSEISKLEAARRQTDCAIRMIFDFEDAIAIHTVANAAFRILRDLAEKQKTETHTNFMDWIKAGYSKRFWKNFNKVANFFKHADSDSDETTSFDPKVNEFTLVFCAQYYHDLTKNLTMEMIFFFSWIYVTRPEILKDQYNNEFADKFPSGFQIWPRSKQLEFGRTVLDGLTQR